MTTVCVLTHLEAVCIASESLTKAAPRRVKANILYKLSMAQTSSAVSSCYARQGLRPGTTERRGKAYQQPY